MARKPGTPNKGSFQKEGHIKNNTLKFRVPEQFLDIVEQVQQKSFLLRGRNKSDLYRVLILEGLLKFVYDPADKEGTESLKEKIQALF